MKRFIVLMGFVVVCAGMAAAKPVRLGALQLDLPTGWRVVQEAESGGVSLMVVESPTGYVTLYQRPKEGRALTDFLHPDSQTVDESKVSYGKDAWTALLSSFRPKKAKTDIFVASRLLEKGGSVYLAFSSHADKAVALDLVETLLSKGSWKGVSSLSLTVPSFKAKKFYLGWSVVETFNSSMMHNEVLFDVLHTQNAFSSEFGGNYLAKALTKKDVTADAVRQAYKDVAAKIGPEDFFLQYSSSHGSKTGLWLAKYPEPEDDLPPTQPKDDPSDLPEDEEEDVDPFPWGSKNRELRYDEIRDTVLKMNAKETVIFTMACYSGNLVDSFNKEKKQWEDYAKQGRTLFVMASSANDQTSHLGPGIDPGEVLGSNGSAGSAFGHALWKGLSGDADGAYDGIKDGFLTLAEIRDFTVRRTKEVGYHTPVFTGSYIPFTVMSRVPDEIFIASLTGGTDKLSDAQVETAVNQLGTAMAVH